MNFSKIAAVLAFISGILLLIGGVYGSTGIVGMVLEFTIDKYGGPGADILSLTLLVLTFIASLGGVAVIGGGVLIYMGRKGVSGFIGRFIIGLGAGMGWIGFFVVLASSFGHGWVATMDFLFLISHSLGWIAIVFAVAAMLLSR